VDLVGSAVLGLHEEPVQQSLRDRLGVLVGRRIGEPGPRVCDLTLAELVEGQTLATDDEGHDLHLLLVAHQLGELLTLLDGVHRVGACQATVSGDEQHRRPLLQPSLGGQRVAALGVGRRKPDGAQQLTRVGLAGLDLLLRLHDARRRDQLHRLRDLLGRLDRSDPATEDA
jgi:hypothetical protein